MRHSLIHSLAFVLVPRTLRGGFVFFNTAALRGGLNFLEVVPMIAIAKQNRSRKSVPAWHNRFLAMMPVIEAHARCVFRRLDPEARQEAVQEVTCNALCAFARLAQLDKLDLAYPSVLAAYGIRQFYDGRRVGNRLNIRDVSSEYCQRHKGISVERLDHYDREEGVWREILIEDHNVTSAELAATRIDFPAWLGTLKPRDRQVALKLATGEMPSRVARMFQVSAGRISQLRKEFKRAWESFHGETGPLEAAAASA